MSRAVIDQPGIRITVIGLALAVFLGLALRSQISDSKVKIYIDQAVQRLESDMMIDYQNAHVNLSKWGLPLPVLEVTQIRLSPKAGHCRDSQVFIDELEIPISLSVLFGFSTNIPKLRLKQVDLRLSDLDRCAGSNGQSLNKHDTSHAVDVAADLSAKALNKNVELARSEHEKNVTELFYRPTGAELHEIYIEKLKIIQSQIPEQPIILKQINIELSYDSKGLSKVDILSKLNALRESKSDLYFINANMDLTIKRVSETQLIDAVLSIEGKMLDGDIQFFTHYIQGAPRLTYEFVVRKVSSKAFGPLLQGNFKKETSAFEKIPISVGFKNTGEIVYAPFSLESKFSQILVNIEGAVLRSNEIRFVHNEKKVKLQPFELWIESLPLTKLKNGGLMKGRLDSFESLGYLTGKLKYTSEEQIQFDGILRQLEIVFSNRSRRDFQRVDEMSFHLKKKENQYSLVADNLVTDGEKIQGEIAIEHNAETAVTEADLKLSGVLLNRRIWDQFTYVEQAPRIDVSWNFKRGEYDEYNMRLSTNRIELPGVVMSNVKLDVQQLMDPLADRSRLNVALRPSSMATTEKLYENEYVNQLFSQSFGANGQTYLGDRVSIQMRGRNWQNLSFDAEAHLLEWPHKKNTLVVDMRGTASSVLGFQSQVSFNQKNVSHRFDLSVSQDQSLSLKKINP